MHWCTYTPVQSVQGYMHTRTSMSTSTNCSHSRNLINSIFVVFAVVSSSNHPHNITVDLSVSSPRLPSVVWYRETDLQCCSSSLTLGQLEAHKLWLLFLLQNSLVLTKSLHGFLQTFLLSEIPKILLTGISTFVSMHEERPLSFTGSKEPKLPKFLSD